MDAITLTAGLALVVFCIVPFVYLIMQGRSSQHQQLNAFKKQAELHHLDVSDMDVWQHRAIALDKTRGWVLFSSGLNDETRSEVLKLIDYSGCKPNEIYRTTAQQGQVLERITLDLSRLNPLHSIKSIVLYDIGEDREAELKHLLELKQKWNTLLSESIKSIQAAQ